MAFALHFISSDVGEFLACIIKMARKKKVFFLWKYCCWRWQKIRIRFVCQQQHVASSHRTFSSIRCQTFETRSSGRTATKSEKFWLHWKLLKVWECCCSLRIFQLPYKIHKHQRTGHSSTNTKKMELKFVAATARHRIEFLWISGIFRFAFSSECVIAHCKTAF